MKLQQLRYVWEVAHHDLNISVTAEKLFTSQPGVSKQIRLLEDELGVQIFSRSGKHLTEITPAGKVIVEMAGRVLNEANNIRRAAQEFRQDRRGELSIATTHAQARYTLPPVVAEFMRRFPNVALRMHQGTPMQIAEMAADGAVDFAISTEAMEYFHDLVMLPCFRWNRCVLVPVDHPLRSQEPLTLEAVARYPIVTYVFGFTGRSQLDEAFHAKGLRPNVVFTASDADVIKTYVRVGLGIGLAARMAYQEDKDEGLVALDAAHLFAPGTTRLGLRRDAFLRGYMYDFIRMFAPHLTREKVNAALQTHGRDEVDALLADTPIPQR